MHEWKLSQLLIIKIKVIVRLYSKDQPLKKVTLVTPKIVIVAYRFFRRTISFKNRESVTLPRVNVKMFCQVLEIHFNCPGGTVTA